MSKSLAKKTLAVVIGVALVFCGTFAVSIAVSVAPDGTGLVKEAQAKVKTKKQTVYRNYVGTWEIKINGKKVTKKQLKKIKFKSSKKAVVKVTSKGKVTALKKGKATLTAKYKGKLIAKHMFTVKEAPKFIGSWKLANYTYGGQSYKEYIDAGVISGKLDLTAKGAGKLTLVIQDEDGTKVPSESVQWLAKSPVKAQIGANGTAVISGAQLTLTVKAESGEQEVYVFTK